MYNGICTSEDYTSTLNCRRERENAFDPYAVAVVNRGIILGHVPRHVSAVFNTFLLRRNNEITCHVTGHRRFSADLPQGGLEIPCQYIFKGPSIGINKVSKLLLEVSNCQ